MSLRLKFNAVLLAAFLVGLSLAAAFSYRIIFDNARREVTQEASIMIAQAVAIRGYTVNEIRPLLAEQMKQRFLPHTVPSWAAQTNLRALTAQFPDYSYKEAALNPTNPADQAVGWEADLITQFQNFPGLKEFSTIRDTPAGPVLSVSRPLRIADKDCLACHTSPDVSPATMVELYGTTGGYGWKVGDVIGAQIVSVPMRVALDRANDLFVVFLGGLAAVFGVTLVVLNVVLHFAITRPLARISEIVNTISLGNLEAPEFDIRGGDEIATLARSFNRLRRSQFDGARTQDQ